MTIKFAIQVDPTTVKQRQENYDKFMTTKDFKGIRATQTIKNDFKMGRILGEGNFGQVRIAEMRKFGIQCAIKSIDKKKNKDLAANPHY